MKKAKPILFSTPMVQALLEDRKTQTRRVMKPQPKYSTDGEFGQTTGWLFNIGSKEQGIWYSINHRFVLEHCPYGKVGDLLWVRETTEADYKSCDKVILSRYSADKQPILYKNSKDPEYNNTVAHWDYRYDKRPSIFMPKWASRLTLEITSIRVEKLQDISRGDAMDEGCPFPNIAKETNPRKWYQDLWEYLNGKNSWDQNSYVWVIEFKVHKCNFQQLIENRG